MRLDLVGILLKRVLVYQDLIVSRLSCRISNINSLTLHILNVLMGTHRWR